ARHSVEADRALQSVTSRGSEPRVPAAEAEADCEDRADPLVAQPLHAGAHVGLDSFRGRLGAMRRVVEVVPALADTRRAPVEVDGDSRKAALGETQGELLIEAVQPANVRKDHDAGDARLLGQRGEGGEAIAVVAFELEVAVVDRTAPDGGMRGHGVELEAHAPSLS